MEDSIIKEGLIYIPKFSALAADKNYGDTVSHEEFNEIVSKNTEQGDYNSEVLRILFTETDDTKTYHIPYLDSLLVENLEKVYDDKEAINQRITHNEETIAGYADIIAVLNETNEDVQAAFNSFLTGETPVGFATIAGHIEGVETAGPDKYYGTNKNSEVGFYSLPPAVYIEDANSGNVDVSAIYIAPRPDSVDEAMLTEAVRTKLNRQQGVTDYQYLTSKPKINNVELNGNVTLAALDVMSKSEHTVDIQSAKDYTDSKHSAALNEVQELEDIVDANYLKKTSAASIYATITNLNNTNSRVSTLESAQSTLSSTVNSINSTVTNNRARVYVQTNEPTGSTLKTGDLWIQV